VKFKLDENLGRATAEVLLEAGFDVVTASDQRLEGALDRDVIECCAREERCLVTLDAEFGNPLLFPPHRYRGIVLLRIPGRGTTELILTAVRTLRDSLTARTGRPASAIALPGPDRRPWVVQAGRVRVYQGEESDNE
jgi:predicted nuclease of predicted toxin-antitoxin system